MKLLIDADGCPVVAEALAVAQARGAECVIVCDTAHQIERPGAKTVVVSKGADSADFALVNLVLPGDIVVTQDYGLAAMCLARNAMVLDQNGMEYTQHNIDSLLERRHINKRVRSAGGRVKGPAHRTAEADRAFAAALRNIFDRLESNT